MYTMTDIEVVKQKKKQNISDEERERRRQRMLALREKLDKASKPIPKKDAKSAIEAKKAEFVKAEAEKIRKQQEQKKKLEPIEEEKKEVVKQPAEPKKKNYKTPARVVDSDSDDEPEVKPKKKTAMRKPPVKKAIKIKYYSDVSVQEMENDAKFLQGLHQVDKSYEKPKEEPKNEDDEKMKRMWKEMGY